MTTSTTEYRLIEKDVTEGIYGFLTTDAVIETGKGERWLIRDGYGGEDALEGGAYRWKFGDAFRLRKGDTLESLHGRKWNDMYSYYDVTVSDADDDRPRVYINGYALAAIAKKLGL